MRLDEITERMTIIVPEAFVGRTPKAFRDAPPHDSVTVAYSTSLGFMVQGLAEDALSSPVLQDLRGNVQLVFTSPPFPLNRKKKYGNLTGQDYIDWLASFAPLLAGLLTTNGSIVMELGNAWEPGQPVMSTLALEALLGFLKEGKLHLCQQFIGYNKARLPSPAQWVNIERIRVKDAYTHIWWMSPSARPKADNRRVLKKYSPAMLELLASGKYNAGKRPSEHNIGATSFLTNNKGAIPSNVLSFSNTRGNDEYMAYCRKKNLPFNPARMPRELPDFFIRFLTEPGDIVLDPFAGSNVTGAVAETLGRKWVSIERDPVYAKTSRSRFRQSRINGRASDPETESYTDIVLERGKRGRAR